MHEKSAQAKAILRAHLARAETPHAAARHAERCVHAGGVGAPGELEVCAGGVSDGCAQHGARGSTGDGRQGGDVGWRE